METLLECDVCLDVIPAEQGEGEVPDYVAHYCGLTCFARWRELAVQSQLPPLPVDQDPKPRV